MRRGQLVASILHFIQPLDYTANRTGYPIAYIYSHPLSFWDDQKDRLSKWITQKDRLSKRITKKIAYLNGYMHFIHQKDRLSFLLSVYIAYLFEQLQLAIKPE